MRSIRQSLLVCFAVLLALALGSVSALAYREAFLALKERQHGIEALLKIRYEERSRREKYKLDDKLLAEARSLAGLMQMHGQVSPPRSHALQMLGVLTSGPAPCGWCTSPLWVAQSWREGAIAHQVHLLRFSTRLESSLPPATSGKDVTYYLQVNLPNGTQWRSASMGPLAFPFDSRTLPGKRAVDWLFDDIELVKGEPLRRVTLKLARFRVGGDRKAKGKNPSAKTVRGRRPTEQALFIQAATSTRYRDQNLASYQQHLNSSLADSAADSEHTLNVLRAQLLGICLLTFAAGLGGGLWLVWIGLRPLRRLGEAVSRVSAKDFRLPLGPAPLPRELQPIAERLAQTLKQLEAAFAREKQAAADISHELRTPLAALMAGVEVALRKPRSAEDYRRVLEDCRLIGGQMGGLVERLLALARLDAGGAQLQRRQVDAGEVVEQCAGLVRPLAEARGLTLRVVRNGPLPAVTDPDKLREVLTNLLHNAIEYNKPEGRVEVGIERRDGHLRLHVRDTGVGIPEEARSHIFERFYRADPARPTEDAHAGIGLAIVKGYVDLLGGSIDVASEVGQGTTFTVTLPAAESG